MYIPKTITKNICVKMITVLIMGENQFLKNGDLPWN